MSTRIVALDRARTFITLLVLLHHSVVNYTYFGHGDKMRWLVPKIPIGYRYDS